MQGTDTSMPDFDRLCRLFEIDPEEFERERERLIEEEISKRPPDIQDRLRKFQWVLDMKRKRCKNPLEACFMFYEMLMENVYGENGLLANFERLLDMAKALKNPDNERLHQAIEHSEMQTRILKFDLQERSKKEHRKYR